MTHTKEEALKLALEVLETGWSPTYTGLDAKEMGIKAITAIKQALAAPVQEPVAWEAVTKLKAPIGTPKLIFTDKTRADEWLAGFVVGHAWLEPLSYTTPAAQPDIVKRAEEAFKAAAQRQWVGLTDAEAQWIYDNARTPSGMIEMTEAKLKEKNTWVGLTRWEIDAKLKENK